MGPESVEKCGERKRLCESQTKNWWLKCSVRENFTKCCLGLVFAFVNSEILKFYQVCQLVGCMCNTECNCECISFCYCQDKMSQNISTKNAFTNRHLHIHTYIHIYKFLNINSSTYKRTFTPDCINMHMQTCWQRPGPLSLSVTALSLQKLNLTYAQQTFLHCLNLFSVLGFLKFCTCKTDKGFRYCFFRDTFLCLWQQLKNFRNVCMHECVCRAECWLQ